VKKLLCKKNVLVHNNNIIRIVPGTGLKEYKIFIRNKYFTRIVLDKIILDFYTNLILLNDVKISIKVYFYTLILRSLRQFGLIKTIYNKNDF
jgi:thermostable 8-oxoguanine DNA glycosylase